MAKELRGPVALASGTCARKNRTGFPLNANLMRSAIHVAAVSGMYLATAMLVPALVDLYYRDNHWRVFAVSAFLTGAGGQYLLLTRFLLRQSQR